MQTVSRPACVTFCAQRAEKVGIVVMMTALGSLRTVQQVNPTDATERKRRLVQYYRQLEDISLKIIHPVINFNLKSISWIILSSLVLTDHMRFPTYVMLGRGERGGGVCLLHPLSLSVQMNALFRNIIHAEAHTEAGNNSFHRGDK